MWIHRVTCILCVQLSTLLLSVTVGALSPAQDHWPHLSDALASYLWPVKGRAIHFLHQIVNDAEAFQVSRSCKISLKHLRDGLKGHRDDAHSFLDSWSKHPSGLMSGEHVDYGHWEQCVQSELREKTSSTPGQYCLLHLKWPLYDTRGQIDQAYARHNTSWIKSLIADSEPFKFGVFAAAACIPATCSRDELQSVVNSLTLNSPLSIEVAESCDTLKDFDVAYSSTPLYKQICGYTLLSLALMVIICTMVAQQKPQLSTHWLVKAFDARNNTVKLNYEILDEQGQQLQFLHGFRTLYLLICIWAHIVFVSGISSKENHTGIVHFQGPSNSILSGLTQMAGLLVSWNVVVGAALAFIVWHPIMTERKGNVSFAAYFIPRILRSTPVMIATLMLIFAYPPSWGSGPVFRKSYARLTKLCLESWWMELLYIGNQRKAMESCIVHGWYIASDLQLYVAAFFIFLSFQKSPKLGVTLCSIGVLVGMVVQALATWYYDTGMSFAFSIQKIFRSIEETHLLHFATLNYISSYCIGILLGFVISHKIILSKRTYIAGWVGAILLTWATSAWHDALFREIEPTRLQVIVTAGLLRTILALVGAWSLYSLWRGIPIFTAMLSSHLFLITGRMNFSTFMVHMLLLWHNDFHLHKPVEYRPFPLISRWLSEIILSHCLGYLMYLVVEAPCNNLTKMILQRKMRTPQDKASKVSRDQNHNKQLKVN